MNRLALWLLCFGFALDLRAQNADAEFLEIYSLIQAGENFEAGGQAAAAADRFLEARRGLEAFAKSHPNWNEKIIKFRLEYLAGKIGGLAPVAAPATPPGSAADREASVPLAAQPRATAVDSGPSPDSLSRELAEARARADAADSRASAAQARIEMALRKADEATVQANDSQERAARIALDLRQARDRLEVLEASHANLEKTRDRLDHEKSTLEARLREALRPKAAAIDPVELAKAEDRILILVKENEILKAGLDYQMAENRRVVETAKKAMELERQLAANRAELAAARKQGDELRAERQKLQSKLDAAGRKTEEATASLKSEIESLRKELAAARAPGKSPAGDAARELAELRQELNERRAATEALRRENDSLVRELEKLTDIRVTPASLKIAEVPGVDAEGATATQLRRLQQERDDLVRELEETRTELRQRDRERPLTAARTRELTREVGRLEARLTALEATAQPYSHEELALFQPPSQRDQLATPPASGAVTPPLQVAQATPPPAGPTNSPPAAPIPSARTNAPAPAGTTDQTSSASTNLVASPSRRRTTKDLPPGASALAAQAQRAFSSRRLADAERSYREILKLDENNVFTLGNLAAIVVEQGRIDESDTLLKRALALDPQDPFCLSLQGIIRFRQQRYDEAFDALSQSAQLDPDNAETQNYLGITLSQRGQRGPAEAALRKALKLNPSSPAAHYNLAVVYATQKPPFLELARYHYEKARRAGQPANPAFEAVLRGETPP